MSGSKNFPSKLATRRDKSPGDFEDNCFEAVSLETPGLLYFEVK